MARSFRHYHSVLVYMALLVNIIAIIAMTTTAAPPLALRVMSYNIHSGRDLYDKLDLPQIGNVIRQYDADIVGLQELGTQ